MSSPHAQPKRPSKRSTSPEDRDETHTSGRQRSREACTPCRRRKRKCNGRLPCGTCVRYEYKCEYTIPPRHSNAQSSETPPEGPQPDTSRPSRNMSQRNPINKLQAHPLTASGARFHHRGILDPLKTRFVRANSAIAFPRILGMEFESDNIPRLHSFAWNLGIRAEANGAIVELPTLLTLAEMQHLAAVYFQIVSPEMGLLDESDFMEKAVERFAHPAEYNDFDAIVLGVAALGSFFAKKPHPREADIVDECQRNLLLFSLNRSPTFHHIAGWVLRTIYLRLTARPHASWIGSCVALHVAEACGLHKEMQTIAVVYPAAPQGDHKLVKSRRRMFWIARALNTLLSFEFGRSRINFEVVTTRHFAPEQGSFAHHFVELAELLPNDFIDRDRQPDPPSALSAALTKTEDLHSDSAFMTMLKADVAFGIYRRLWLMSLTDAKDRSESVMTIGRAALAAVKRSLASRTSWWNLVGVPFQFVCVLLAIDTPRSLALLPETLALLRGIAAVYDTHMVREAYNQAAALVQMSGRRKDKEMQLLQRVVGDVELFDDTPRSSSAADTATPLLGMDGMPSVADWAEDVPFAWDMFLNPELVISQQQGQALGPEQGGGTAPYEQQFPY